MHSCSTPPPTGVEVEVLTEEYRRPHASKRVRNFARGISVGERLRPGPESLKRYDNFSGRLIKERNKAQSNSFKLYLSRSEDDPEYKEAAAAHDKARARYDNFVNKNTANVASILNAEEMADDDLESAAKYTAAATEKSIRRHERKTAPRVKLTRADRRKRRADREAAAEEKRKEAARNALTSYERQAQEYAADQDDVRGGTFHKGTILSKREQFDRNFKTPDKKYNVDRAEDKLHLEYAKHYGASNERKREIAKRLGLTPRKTDERAQETSGDNQPIASQKPSEDNANSASPHQDSKPLTKSQPASRPDPQEPQSEPKANPKSSATSSQPSPPPATPTKPKFHLTGKQAAGAALAVTGVAAAGLAARHIYKKRQERKRKEREAAEKSKRMRQWK